MPSRWLLTRPRPLNMSLAMELTRLGDQCFEHPLLEIKGLPMTSQEAVLQSQTLWDRVIFTSQPAVQYARILLPAVKQQRPQPLYYAVGQATANRLAREGLSVQTGQDIGSESLLEAMRPLPHGQSILLVTGHGGRRVLDRALMDDGHDLTRCEVYRRSSLVNANLDQFVQDNFIDTVLITSVQALEALDQSLGVAKRGLLQLVVISERIADLANGQGYARVVISTDLRAEALRMAIE